MKEQASGHGKTNRWARTIRGFIRKYDLHRSLPVSLNPLLIEYPVEYVAFSSDTFGAAVNGTIAINSRLHAYEQRMTIAHEVSHLVLKHPDSLFLRRIGGWWYSRLEQEAQESAAVILVPAKALSDYIHLRYSTGELEQVFEVPAELIELRLKMSDIIV